MSIYYSHRDCIGTHSNNQPKSGSSEQHGILANEVEVAVREEHANAVVRVGDLNIGPVCHIEHLVHSHAPVVGCYTDSTFVLLRPHAAPVESVTR